jgi:hypothetical protein
MLPEAVLDYVMNERIAGGKELRRSTVRITCRCQGDDAWVAIAIETEEEWRHFCQAVEHPEWISDELPGVAAARRTKLNSTPLLQSGQKSEPKPPSLPCSRASGWRRRQFMTPKGF